ncbi:MAG: hypothetical protein MJZ06_03910 [Bacteroidaceae bacterium]|nr:hypothetical protein [Bacteroidaceae bacterium]
MKKFYSFVTIMAALALSMPTKAEVQSATELFGIWTFTADIQYNDDSYKDKILEECEVKIFKDASGTFEAEIDGLCGVENSYQMSTLKTQDGVKALKVTNPNGGGYDAWGALGLWMADTEGNNPFGPTRLGSLFYKINDEGTEITIPDFTFVSVSDIVNAEKGTIVAALTNVKLTLKEKEKIEIKDLSGSYEFNATTLHDYGVVENWPTGFAMEVVSKSDDNTQYDVTWTWEQFGSITMDGAFDGNILNLSYDSQVVAYDSIYLAPSTAISLSGKIGFNLVGDNLSMSTGCTFAVPFYNESSELDSLSYIFWYGGGVAKKAKDAPAFDYTGTYHAKGNVSWNPGIVENVNLEGDIVIEYNEKREAYVVTKFMDYSNPYTLNYDQMYLVPDDEDPMKATITSACLEFIGVTEGNDYKYLATRDGNLQENSVKVTFDADGNMTIGEICYATTTMKGTENDALAVWFSSIKAVKDVLSAQDWVGTFKVNDIDFAYLAANPGFTVGDSITIAYYENSDDYVVMSLLGNETYIMNQGAMRIIPGESNPHVATLTYGILTFDGPTMQETSIYPVNLDRKGTIEITLNDDGTVTLGDFSVAKGPWNGVPAKVVATTDFAAAQAIIWNGSHKLSEISYAYIADGETVPANDTIVISFWADYGFYTVDSLMGYDTYTFNQGMMEIVPDANDLHKATMTYGILDFDGPTMQETSIYNIDESRQSVIELTIDDNGVITLGDFTIAKGAWNGAIEKIIASTRIPSNVEPKTVEADGKMYNLNGVETDKAEGIVIMKVGGKSVKVLMNK